GPLAAVWRAGWHGELPLIPAEGLRKIERELVRLLENLAENDRLAPAATTFEIRLLVNETSWDMDRQTRGGRDIQEGVVELLVTALRYLARRPSPENVSVIRSVARSSFALSTPNARIVQ